MPGGNRESRLERNAAAVDKANGVQLLVKPMVHDQHAGNIPDPAREEFNCVGLLYLSAATSNKLNFPGQEQNTSVRVGKSESRIRKSQILADFTFQQGDLIEANTDWGSSRFEVLNIDPNDPVRVTLTLKTRD